jgi:hypothetical protein
MTFHDDEHRINNTGRIWNGDETEGWNESKTMEGMLNVFQSTFSRSGKKKISRICTCKTERTLQILG